MTQEMAQSVGGQIQRLNLYEARGMTAYLLGALGESRRLLGKAFDGDQVIEEAIQELRATIPQVDPLDPIQVERVEILSAMQTAAIAQDIDEYPELYDRLRAFEVEAGEFDGPDEDE